MKIFDTDPHIFVYIDEANDDTRFFSSGATSFCYDLQADLRRRNRCANENICDSTEDLVSDSDVIYEEYKRVPKRKRGGESFKLTRQNAVKIVPFNVRRLSVTTLLGR